MCISREDGYRPGGVFLDLPLLHTSTSDDICTARRWQDLCQRVMIALANAWPLFRGRDVCKTALTALTSNVTFGEIDSVLASTCSAVRRRVWEGTRCLVGHAVRVQETVLKLGCDEIIGRAFNRLGQLSHVLFMDASKFSSQHALEMATRGNVEEIDNTLRIQRVNTGISNEPFVENESMQFNRCSLRFCARLPCTAPPSLDMSF